MRPEVLAALVEHVGRLCEKRAQQLQEEKPKPVEKKASQLLRPVGPKPVEGK